MMTSPSLDYGYLDSGNYTPEEMIIAAGLVPKRLLGNPTMASSVEADKYIEPTHCLFARNVLNAAILGQFKHLAGALFTHGCDVTSRQYDVWRAHAEIKDIWYLHVPLKRDETAVKFLMKELGRFKTHLEKLTGKPITSEALNAAIDLCNETRALLGELAEFRKQKPPAISGSEFFTFVAAAQTMEKQAANEKIKTKIAELKNANPSGAKHPRVLVMGTALDYPDFLQLVEMSGFMPVCEAMALGADYFATRVQKTGDPLKDIAQFLSKRQPNPTKHPPDQYLDFALDLAKQYEVDGVIYQALKFCEPYLYDSVYILNRLKEEGIPALYVEHEYATQGLSGLRTRIEAFKEVIGGNK